MPERQRITNEVFELHIDSILPFAKEDHKAIAAKSLQRLSQFLPHMSISGKEFKKSACERVHIVNCEFRI